MRLSGAGMLIAAFAVHLCAIRSARAQQTSSSIAARIAGIEPQRVRSFIREFDIVLESPDSTLVLGVRRVSLERVTHAGTPAWVIVERRTGIVSAVESLFVSPAFLPLHWSAMLGPARLGASFSRDSIFGATTSPLGRQNIVTPAPGPLVVSSAMLEVLLPLLAIPVGWADSVGVLSVSATSTAVLGGQLVSLADRSAADSTGAATQVVALGTEAGNVFFWLDVRSGAVTRVQHLLHGGEILEYRSREVSSTTEVQRPPS